MALDKKPSVFADLDILEKFHARFDIIEDISEKMKSMMWREIRIKIFSTMIPTQMIDEISNMSFEDTEWNKNCIMMELFQLRMEESTNLEDHLVIVTSIVDCLYTQLDCFVEHGTLAYAVLATSTPRYHRDVDPLIRGGVNGIELHKLKDLIRTTVPKIDEPDFIDWYGIYDISVL